MPNKVEKYLTERGYYTGRLITSVSKSAYYKSYPSHIVLFNARLYNTKGKEVWWGDVDLSYDWKVFLEASCSLNQTLILTPETPYRFTGLKEMLKTSRKFQGGLSTKRKGSLGAPVIIVRNAKNLKKDHSGIWVFACKNKDEEVLKELKGLLE